MYGVHIDPTTNKPHRNDHICNQHCRDLAAVARAERAEAKANKEKDVENSNDMPYGMGKYVKISLIVDDGVKTSVQTFYRAKDITYEMETVNADKPLEPVLYDFSFKAERDQEKDCMSTSESFPSNDGEIYIRRGGIIRKLGL